MKSRFNNIKYEISWKSYLYTILNVSWVCSCTFLKSIISAFLFKITDKNKQKRSEIEIWFNWME